MIRSGLFFSDKNAVQSNSASNCFESQPEHDIQVVVGITAKLQQQQWCKEALQLNADSVPPRMQQLSRHRLRGTDVK